MDTKLVWSLIIALVVGVAAGFPVYSSQGFWLGFLAYNSAGPMAFILMLLLTGIVPVNSNKSRG